MTSYCLFSWSQPTQRFSLAAKPCSWIRSQNGAIDTFVLSRLTLTACILVALVTSAVRLPASVCPVVSAPIGKSCRMGCCVNKACCCESQKTRSLPSAPAVKDSGANQQLVAISVADKPLFCAETSAFQRTDFAAAKSIVSAQPQLAVLCSFLI
jgi:hypothetical protein